MRESLQSPDLCLLSDTVVQEIVLRHTGITLQDHQLDRIKKLLQRSSADFRAAFMSGDPEIMQEVIDTCATTTDTMFFREPKVLRGVTEYLETLLPEKIAKNDRSISMISAGASTGAELYSMIITLLESLRKLGENPLKWRIKAQGFDINTKELNKAREAKYDSERCLMRLYSDPTLVNIRNRYFKAVRPYKNSSFITLAERIQAGFLASSIPETEAEFIHLVRREGGAIAVSPEVTRYAEFCEHDLKKPLPTSADIVLCCNVFMYFDQAGKNTVAGNLLNALSQNGRLFYGSATLELNALPSMLNGSKYEGQNFKSCKSLKVYSRSPAAACAINYCELGDRPASTRGDTRPKIAKALGTHILKSDDYKAKLAERATQRQALIAGLRASAAELNPNLAVATA